MKSLLHTIKYTLDSEFHMKFPLSSSVLGRKTEGQAVSPDSAYPMVWALG